MELREKALRFLAPFSQEERRGMKAMLGRGVICGAGFARQCGFNETQFSDELKDILEGKF